MISHINVQAKFKSWLDKRTFRPHKLREALVGSVVNIATWEVVCYSLLQGIVKAGEASSYLPDAILVTMALLEVFISPFVSWYGYRRRRSMIVASLPVLVLLSIMFFFMPEVHQSEETEFCPGSNSSVTKNMSHTSALRLCSVFCVSAMVLLARVAIWCHGVAYIEERAPDRVSVHLGVLIFARVIPLALCYRVVGTEISFLQITVFVITFTIQALQILYFMPPDTLQDRGRLEIPEQNREFLVSVGRVLSNPLAVSQMISLGLLAAATWGYSFHSSDIIKVKFLISKNDMIVSFMELFQSYGILLAVLYIGLKWSSPIQSQFCKSRALRQSLAMCVVAGVLYGVLTLGLKCEHGRVGGLEPTLYTNPSCSEHCGCTERWLEFSPVCVAEDMTTYLSPCQAGCGGADTLSGLVVYKNCSCAGGGRALNGACGSPACETVAAMQRAIYVLLLTASLIGFQSHLVLLLKTVDPRDKSVVLGLTGSSVALFAFVLGHVSYHRINVSTCIWWGADRCQFHSTFLPLLVGGTSAAIAALSGTICLFPLLWMWARKASETTL